MTFRLKPIGAVLACSALALVPLSAAGAAGDTTAPAEERAAPVADAKADAEYEASLTAEALEVALGDDYAGAWIDGDVLKVAATTTGHAVLSAVPSDVEIVHADRPLSDLEDITADLADAADPPDAVASWGPDAPTNSVVVFTSDTDAAAEWVESSGVDADVVRYEYSNEEPQLLQDIRGGDAYYFGQGRCSVGFSVTGAVHGYVSAGHCGSLNQAVRGHNQQPQGTIVRRSFPGNDYNAVQINQNWTVRPWVNTYPGTMDVRGSTVAPVGSQLCRSGSTSRFTCQGQVLQFNTCVTYPQGTICGLTRTNVPAAPGDSGGSIITRAGQAQGMTSGGGGGIMYFQPLNPVLSALNLNLVTTDNGGGPEPEPPEGCEDYNNTYTGSLSLQGSAYHPAGGYTAPAGVHEICLAAPAGFIVFLERQFGNQWHFVYYAAGSETEKRITYNGAPGTYRVHVQAWSEGGEYTLGVSGP
ncbi:S1 family peptidase [Phytoactinopolyspora limicola]|uniref:S1 family peptidase n=1 Tax=Phytoactinopolyspora limicola TaxID=2715536 RepID=UPI00140C424A|nr:S1 family peptidase [Phytoactinopolyspora limicola]